MFGALESGMLGEEFVAYEVQVAQKYITCIAATGISSEVKQKRDTLVAIMPLVSLPEHLQGIPPTPRTYVQRLTTSKLNSPLTEHD
jgi:hypothetical protein